MSLKQTLIQKQEALQQQMTNQLVKRKQGNKFTASNESTIRSGWSLSRPKPIPSIEDYIVQVDGLKGRGKSQNKVVTKKKLSHTANQQT